jgi:site-specific DNA-methyltransferase (adenine-specific)
MDWKNKLYFGDNLNILRDCVLDASIDLIYLDPPFNSNANYNVLFKEKSGEESAAQITAFEDTWQWSLEAEAVYKEIVTSGPRKLADLMQPPLGWRFADTVCYVDRRVSKGRNVCYSRCPGVAVPF